MPEHHQLVAEKVHFHQLCKVFESIRESPKEMKGSVFKQFIKEWHQQLKHMLPDGSFEFRNDDTFYEALRLFVPSKDERKFGIKGPRLGRLVSDVALTPQMELTLATEVLVSRLVEKVGETLCAQTPSLSIKQVNDYLDGMKYPSEKRHQEHALGQLFRGCTRLELKWLFHIILDDMEKALGHVSSSTLLRWFHKDALDSFMSGDNLQQICQHYVGEESGETTLFVNGNLLCKPIRPMLLKRLNFDKYCLPKIIKYCNRPFYVEVKYDGEHLLLHRYNFNQYKYFTRNGNDYTHKLGADSGALMSAQIHSYIWPEIRECLLDCELILWDKNIQSFVGKSKKASDGKVYDVKHIDDDYIKNHSHLQRSLAVFDVLYLNGESLVDKPLIERLKILRTVLKEEDKSVIFISEKRVVQAADEFANFYRGAMRNGEEGVVVKAFNSVYRPGSRAERNGWFKIKPDYGVQSVLDLAVIGIRFENDSLAHIKSFLVAARVPGSSNSNLRFKIVAGVTSHLKALDFKRLLELLGGDKEAWREGVPEWVELNGGRTGKNDRFVQKENIQVVEVRASGLLNGILQFPSIVSIRNDKPVSDTDSLHDVLRFDERLRSRPIIDETDPHEAAVLLNRKRKQNWKLKQSNQLVTKGDGSLEETISDTLRGRKVCVLNGNSKVSAQDLQKILISLGATPISNPGKAADFLVAMDAKPISCVAAIKADKYHIVHGNWLLRCKEKGALLPWNRSDMLHISSKGPFDLFSLPSTNNGQVGDNDSQQQSEETSSVISRREGSEERMDDDGEGEEDEESIEREMARVADNAISEERKICDEVDKLVVGTDCSPAKKGNLFTDFEFYIHESVNIPNASIVQLRENIEAQSGQISESLSPSVSHVIIDQMTPDQGDVLFTWNEQQKMWLGQFVTVDWVEQAIHDEDRYRMVEQLHNWIH